MTKKFALLVAIAAGALPSSASAYSPGPPPRRSSSSLFMSVSEQEAQHWSQPKKDFRGGAGVGRLTLDTRAAQADAWRCKYDMILAERIQDQPETETGLFVPRDDLPKLHLCRVLSVGAGREEENGRIAPMPDVKVGDVIIAKNPWGIGPKDEETGDGKKLSFMRAQDVAAVVTGELVEEE